MYQYEKEIILWHLLSENFETIVDLSYMAKETSIATAFAENSFSIFSIQCYNENKLNPLHQNYMHKRSRVVFKVWCIKMGCKPWGQKY